MMRRALLFAGGLVVFAAFSAMAGAPLVDAGEDEEYTTNDEYISFYGSITYDGQLEDLVIEWKQISGPAQAVIFDPAIPTSGVSFAQVGAYVFELSASDGAVTATDRVTITIAQALAFLVLEPSNDQEISLGSTFTIRWQRDPLVPCQVFYSLDGGLTSTQITDLGAVTGPTINWEVPDTLAPGTRGIIIVHRYNTPADQAVGTFVLVDRGVSDTSQPAKKSGCGAGAGLALIPPLFLRRKRRRSQA